MFSKLLKPKSDQAVPVCKPLSDAQLRDRVRGSIFAGAVGDALGYPIEFWNEKRIFGQYGKKGITWIPPPVLPLFQTIPK